MEKTSSARLSPSSDLPDIGSGYETLCLVGQGGMGQIYLVRQQDTQNVFAAKLLRAELASDEGAVKRFEQEVVAASNLDHPNTVPVYGYGKAANGAPYLLMDYVEGSNLGQAIAELGPLDLERAQNIFSQILDALAHAHSKGIVHRDLKPSNILISTKDGVETAQLVDFGISKLQMRYGETVTNLTQTGAVFGSPTYMSPEQCEGEEIDRRSDIYSLGCVMFEILSGAPPYSGANPFKVMTKHVSEPIPELSRTDVPDYLKQIITTCLEKEPHNRYQNVEQLSNDLYSKKATRLRKKAVRPKERAKPPSFRFNSPAIVIGTLVGVAILGFSLLWAPKSATVVSLPPIQPPVSNAPKVVMKKPVVELPVIPPLQTLPPAMASSLVRNITDSERQKFREFVAALRKHSTEDSFEKSELDQVFKQIKAHYRARTIPVLLAMTEDRDWPTAQCASLFLRENSALKDRIAYLSVRWSHNLAASMAEGDIVPFSKLVLSANPEIAERAIQEMARFTIAESVGGYPHRRVNIPDQLCDSLLWYAINSKTDYTRQQAAVSLTGFCADRRVSQTLAHVALNDPSEAARREAGLALVKAYVNRTCGYDPYQVLSYIFQFEPEDSVVSPILYLVSKGTDRQKVAGLVPVLRKAMDARSDRVKETIVSIFESLGPAASEATPELVQALKSERVRPNAIVALTHVEATSAIPELVTIQRSDRTNATLASFAIQHLEGNPDDEFAAMYLRFRKKREQKMD